MKQYEVSTIHVHVACKTVVLRLPIVSFERGHSEHRKCRPVGTPTLQYVTGTSAVYIQTTGD